MDEKKNKVVRGYSLKAENVTWLRSKAAGQTLMAERTVSTSEMLDRVIEAAREAERDALLAKVKAEAKVAA